ncbi:hypothetical protein PC9H_008968 [Pleurotus ostreatus]|uniref:Uncharacterized protein n=1 Tax=Pleurotus ostreatus TaxID=5322 RepID=A0A8H7DPJ8_PLEOS|nr:uncharacterized protein PC9H_008968 [Pleurotus ostreatus]KAF7426599.1 hypothetical protein PC9H_008968 [Pleurotus ostreatus]
MEDAEALSGEQKERDREQNERATMLLVEAVKSRRPRDPAAPGHDGDARRLALLPPGSVDSPTIASEPSSAGPFPIFTLDSLISTPRSPTSAVSPDIALLAQSTSATVRASLPSLRKATLQPPTSPQAASLGRTTGGGAGAVAEVVGAGNGTAGSNTSTMVLRQNSLGDSKIPACISQTQVGLRRDLSLVREFAAAVESERIVISETMNMFSSKFVRPQGPSMHV